MDGVRVATYACGVVRPAAAGAVDGVDEFGAVDDTLAEDDALGTGVHGR